MSNAELKYNLFKAIDAINDTTVLQNIYNLVAKGKTAKGDWWDDLTPVQKASIERGLNDIEENKVYSHEEVLLKSKALLDKHRKASK